MFLTYLFLSVSIIKYLFSVRMKPHYCDIYTHFPAKNDRTEWRAGWNWYHSSTLATSCEELTHWKRLWCWEGLGAGGEGDGRGWDGWMASLTRWTWVWVNSMSWWWTGRPGVLRFMGSQRVGHDWATELNWDLGLNPGLDSYNYHFSLFIIPLTLRLFIC